MKMNRRNVLLGLGTVVAGGGAALGTGAFSSVEADRSVSVETAADSEALLALEANENYVGEIISDNDDELEIDIGGETTAQDGEGVNRNAVTTIEELVDITNQGTQNIEEITFSVSGDGEDIISAVPETITNTMTPGDTESFGIKIDLTLDDTTTGIDDGDIDDDNFDPIITIETSDST